MLRGVSYSFHLTVCVCLLFNLFVFSIAPTLDFYVCAYLCTPCGFMCVSVCERCNAFHSGCGFGSAITQRCSQFVVDLPLSPSISG